MGEVGTKVHAVCVATWLGLHTVDNMSEPARKKRKIEDENRQFKEE